jgi:serine protease inhibitor
VTAPDLRFALELHDRLAGADRTAGFVWSPYSVASALGLAAAGARGATLEEIAVALGAGGRPADLAVLAAALADGARLEPEQEGMAGARIAVANTLWADLTLPVVEAYLAAVRDWPGGAARAVDFAGDPDGARRAVNADVEHTTNGLIRDLLAAGQVGRDTRAILVNALWLRASWIQAFPAAATRPLPFHAPGGDVEVPTMRVERRMRYAERHGWRLVVVPAGSGVVADVLLPDGDLAAAESALQPATLAELTAAAAPVTVALYLPRFRVQGQAALTDPLAGLGVRRLFSNDCDLSGVTGGAESLKVSAAVHKAVLTVDESGLEGAAATAVMMVLTAATARPRPVELRVDRPFLVLVRHEGSGALYFLARVTRP